MFSRLAARRRGLLRPTPSSWMCFPAPLRSSLWIGPMRPASLSRRSSTSGSLVARTPGLKEGSHHFSVICITRSPDPENSLFPPVLLTRQPLTSGSEEQGYTAIPVVEDTLASHLSPSLAPSWKSRPLLPTKPCRTTFALIGKSYIAAGQAGMTLHTMAILQAYQADASKRKQELSSLLLKGAIEEVPQSDIEQGFFSRYFLVQKETAA